LLDVRQQVALCHAVASQLVGHDHPRHIFQTLQQTPEEALGGFTIAPLLNEDVEHNAIHGAPKIMLHAADPDEYLVDVPLVSRPWPAAAKVVGKALAEFLAPASNGLIGDDNTTLGQKQMNTPQAETEHMIQPDRMADDLDGKAMPVARIGWRFHAASLPDLR